MSDLIIREAQAGDETDLAQMMAYLWPDGSVDEHRREAEELIRTRRSGTLPATFFVATSGDEELIGWIQVGLRSHADGCDATQPVGFIEGWFVRDGLRGKGIGRRLMQVAEEWARKCGCREMASDALLDNEASHRAHRASGFEVIDRCVHFRKTI